jgi:hypothetical protein
MMKRTPSHPKRLKNAETTATRKKGLPRLGNSPFFLAAPVSAALAHQPYGFHQLPDVTTRLSNCSSLS